jgi:hypothetical protein
MKRLMAHRNAPIWAVQERRYALKYQTVAAGGTRSAIKRLS